MPTLKKRSGNFTIISNTAVNDTRLKHGAFGLLVRLASKPDGWNFSIRGLAAEYADGRDSTSAMLNKLEELGYLMRNSVVDENGKFVDTEYVFNDEPMPEAIAAFQAKQAKKEERKAKKNVDNDLFEKEPVAEKPPRKAKKATKNKAENGSEQNLESQENNVDMHFSPCTENPDTVIFDEKSVGDNVAEKPCPENPDPGFPDPGNPYSNIRLYNTRLYNNISYQSYQTNTKYKRDSDISDKIDMIDEDEKNNYREIIKENIEYDWFLSAYQEKKTANRPHGSANELNDVVEIITDVVSSSAPTVRVGKEDKPIEVVRSQFLKLRQEDIQFLFDSLDKNTTKIHNPKAYIITALYNAPITKNISISADVRSDLYGSCDDDNL